MEFDNLTVWQSIKQVRAARIIAVTNQTDKPGAILHLDPTHTGLEPAESIVEVTGLWLSKRVPQNQSAADGYFVLYDDNYTSWSPADAFERGNVLPGPMWTKYNHPVLAKCAPDEPIFVLRAKDAWADSFVDAWADRFAAKRGRDHVKAISARLIACLMRAWPGRKIPD